MTARYMHPFYALEVPQRIPTQISFYHQRQMVKFLNSTGATLLPLMHFILRKFDEEREIGISSDVQANKTLYVNSDRKNKREVKLSGLEGKAAHL